MTQEHVELIMDWERKSIAAKAAVEAEREARVKLNDLFAEQTGTQYFQLSAGWRLKGVFKTNFTLNPETFDSALEKMRAEGNEGTFLADRVIRYKPELVQGEYNKMAPQYREILDTCITTSPGLPSFELVAPKNKAK